MTKLSVFTLNITQIDSGSMVGKKIKPYDNLDDNASRVCLDRLIKSPTISCADHDNSTFNEELYDSSSNTLTSNFTLDGIVAGELELIIGESIRLYPVQVADTFLNSSRSATVTDDSSLTTTESIGVSFAAIFCHPNLINAALHKVKSTKISQSLSSKMNDQQLRSSPVLFSSDGRKKEEPSSSFSFRLLSLISPFVAENFSIKAIVSLARNNTNQDRNYAAADVVLVNIRHAPPYSIIDDLMQATSCQTMNSGPEHVLKILLLNSISFDQRGPRLLKSLNMSIDIPTCPVCLHRIDPKKLGLPTLKLHQLCSKFCPKPALSEVYSEGIVLPADMITCPRQFLLRPWPLPTYCASCHVIESYWKNQTNCVDEVASPCTQNQSGIGNGLSCSYCSMQETLWVCLTCAFIGCGRYSNKHAAQHNNETSHPFCLELSTGRIWSYVDSEYSHRVDLLDCPCSLPKISTLIARLNSSHFAMQNKSHLPDVESNNAISNNSRHEHSLPSSGMACLPNRVAATCQGRSAANTSKPSSLTTTDP
jgi:Zn-finger in ubiquitin-hydrolases and other protein